MFEIPALLFVIIKYKFFFPQKKVKRRKKIHQDSPPSLFQCKYEISFLLFSFSTFARRGCSVFLKQERVLSSSYLVVSHRLSFLSKRDFSPSQSSEMQHVMSDFPWGPLFNSTSLLNQFLWQFTLLEMGRGPFGVLLKKRRKKRGRERERDEPVLSHQFKDPWARVF